MINDNFQPAIIWPKLSCLDEDWLTPFPYFFYTLCLMLRYMLCVMVAQQNQPLRIRKIDFVTIFYNLKHIEFIRMNLLI